MSDEPVKAEFVVRIEQMSDVVEAEKELRAAASAFEAAEREAVQAAERLIDWADTWQYRRAKVLNPELAALTPEQATFYGRGNHLANARALMALFCERVRVENGGPTGGGDDGGTISLDRSDLTGHPNAPDESGSSAASFDLDSLSPEERQEMIDRAVGDEAEQARAVQAFEEQEGEDYAAVRDRAGEVEIPEGFTKWEGGECPVPYGTRVAVFYRGHYSHEPHEWESYGGADTPETWAHDGSDGDIIAYRIIEPAGGYAPVTEADDTITLAELDNESADILTDPDLQAKADEMRATLAAGTLVDPELDAELTAARKREGGESKPRFSIFGGGKLVGAQ